MSFVNESDELNFVNRSNELNFVKKSIEDGCQIVYFVYETASGISAFLNKCASEFQESTVFHLDALDQSDFATAFCGKAPGGSNFSDILQKNADEKFGTKSQSFLSALVKSLPYGGELLNAIIEKPSSSPIYMGSYNSIYEQIIFPTIDEIRKERKLVVFIDNAHMLTESSIKLCCKLTDYNNVYFVFAFAKNGQATEKYESLISFSLNSKRAKPKKYEFNHPDTKMIQLLAEQYQIKCSTEQAENIAKIQKDNLHAIVMYLIEYNEKEKDELNPIQKIIIDILHEVDCSIPIQLLNSIIEYHNKSILYDKMSVNNSLEGLRKLRVIEDGEELIWLISKNHPKVVEVLKDWLLLNSIKSAILEVLYTKKAYEKNETFLKVSYEIALSFHDNRYIEFSKILLRNAVATGKTISEETLTSCLNNANSEKVILTLVIYLTQCRRYAEALELINKCEITTSTQSLYAVLLNRCRHHKKAEEELNSAIENETDSAKKMILYAYLISNNVHDNDIKKAKQIFDAISNELHLPSEYAYVLRNIATIFPPEQAIEYSKNAAKIFNENNDSFSEFTAKCNECRFLCEQGEYKNALEKMKLLLNNVTGYRNSDMHILLNNIAICNIYLNDTQEAEYYLRNALIISKSPMTDIFIKINQSLSILLAGDGKKSLEIMESIKELALSYPVDRIRQRFFVNYCHILYANNCNYDEYLEKAKIFKDRITPERTEKLCEFYKTAQSNNRLYLKKDFFDLFVPCYLEYWYTEPLKLVPSDIIDNILPIHA